MIGLTSKVEGFKHFIHTLRLIKLIGYHRDAEDAEVAQRTASPTSAGCKLHLM